MSTFVCACGTCAHLSTRVEVRGQGKGVSSPLSQYGSWDWTWLARLGCKHLYTSSHLSCLTSFGLQLVSDDEKQSGTLYNSLSRLYSTLVTDILRPSISLKNRDL